MKSDEVQLSETTKKIEKNEGPSTKKAKESTGHDPDSPQQAEINPSDAGQSEDELLKSLLFGIRWPTS